MPRFRRSSVVLAVACLGLLIAGPSGAAGDPVGKQSDAEECNPYAPESVSAWTGSGTEIDLSVLVLLDGVTKPAAEAIVGKAAGSYQSVGVALEATYQKASFEPGIIRAEQLIAIAREQSGGARPLGIDAVYILTNRDITIATGDAVGYSDCIGGIRYPNRGYAIGEAIDEPLRTAGLNFYVDGPAKTLAHEIGHLMGSRHEHANCAEGVSSSDVTGSDPTPCTLMTSYLDLQSSNFGTLERFIVRAYAERYAAP